MTRFVEFSQSDGLTIHVNPDQVQVVCDVNTVKSPDDGQLTALSFQAKDENPSFVLVRGETADVLRRLESRG